MAWRPRLRRCSIHRRTATRSRPATRTPPRRAGCVAVGRTRGRPDGHRSVERVGTNPGPAATASFSRRHAVIHRGRSRAGPPSEGSLSARVPPSGCDARRFAGSEGRIRRGRSFPGRKLRRARTRRGAARGRQGKGRGGDAAARVTVTAACPATESTKQSKSCALVSACSPCSCCWFYHHVSVMSVWSAWFFPTAPTQCFV